MEILSQASWAEVVRLFGDGGMAGGCWCMFWRQTNQEAAGTSPDDRREAFRTLVEAGEPVGLLAVDGGEPVGWCAVAPRTGFRRIPRTKALAPADPDNPSIWAVTCFVIRSDRRRQGIAAALLDAAVARARSAGATQVEGYPVVEATGGPAKLSTGTVGLFAAAGFTRDPRSGGGRRVVMQRSTAET